MTCFYHHDHNVGEPCSLEQCQKQNDKLHAEIERMKAVRETECPMSLKKLVKEQTCELRAELARVMAERDKYKDTMDSALGSIEILAHEKSEAQSVARELAKYARGVLYSYPQEAIEKALSYPAAGEAVKQEFAEKPCSECGGSEEVPDLFEASYHEEPRYRRCPKCNRGNPR